jgi:hypothetical protein
MERYCGLLADADEAFEPVFQKRFSDWADPEPDQPSDEVESPK